MATLTGSTIASTYKQLLKVTSEGIGADASAKYIEDGLGTDSALSISTTRVGIGTAAPSTLLHLSKSSDPTLTITNAGTATLKVIVKDDSSTYFSIDAAASLKFATSSNGTSNVRLSLDDNSRISLSNNDASGAVGTTIFGYLAGDDIASTGTINTLFGHNAGHELKLADNNTAIGYNAMFNSYIDDTQDALTVDNIFIGKSSGAGAWVTAAPNKNVAVGNLTMTGAMNNAIENVMIGHQAGEDIVNAQKGTYVGFQAGYNNVSGSHSTIIGHNAGSTATDLDKVVLVGVNAGAAINNNTADNTVAIGYNSLTALTSGARNTAVGYQCMDATDDGAYNTAVGYQALSADCGNNNVAMGTSSLLVCTGEANTSIGAEALKALVGGTYNTAVGNGAGAATTDVDNTVLIGNSAGAANMTSAADGTVAVGHSALNALTSGAGNTAVGYTALTTNIDGDFNTAVGYESLYTFEADADGHGQNTAIGYRAGKFISTGTDNTFLGSGAGQGITGTPITGNGSVVIGANAGLIMQGASSDNVIIGISTADAMTTGSNNIVLGGAAGTYSVDLEDGDGNVIIGSYSHTSATDSDYQIVFGFNVVGNGDNTLTFGNAGADVSCAFSGTTWSNPSDERIKKDIETSTLGLSFINDLRPVTFKFKTKGELPESHSDYVEDSTESFQDEKIHHGYIAQEVKEAMDSAGDSVKDGFEGWGLNAVNDFQRVGEGAFVGALIKAVQELTAKVEALENA